MKKRIWLSLSLIPFIGLACSEGGVAGANSEKTKMSGKMEGSIFALTENTIIVQKQVCNAGVLEPELDTTFYQVQNGTFYQWDAEQCQAAVWKGSSSTVIGTWTYSNEFAAIPTGTPEDCDDSESDGSIPSDYTATLQITATSLTVEMSAEICYAEMMAEMGDGEYVADGCNKFYYTNSRNGKEATFTILEAPKNLFNSSVKMQFEYGGKTCVQMSYPDLEPTAAVCAQSWASFVADENDIEDWENDEFTEDPRNETLMLEYSKCVRETGFYDTAPTEQAQLDMKRLVSIIRKTK